MQGEPRQLLQPGLSWAWQHGYDIYGPFIVKGPYCVGWGPGVYHVFTSTWDDFYGTFSTFRHTTPLDPPARLYPFWIKHFEFYVKRDSFFLPINK